MIEVRVAFLGDEEPESWMLFGELEYRFGKDHIVSRQLVGDDDDDDETADEIINMLDNPILNDRVDRIAEEHGMERNVAIEVMRGLVSGVIEVDPAPPHGIATVNAEGSLVPAGMERPRPTDNGPIAIRAKKWVIEHAPCPTCGAPPGRNCGSKGQNYGTQHVHSSRIDLIFGKR